MALAAFSIRVKAVRLVLHQLIERLLYTRPTPAPRPSRPIPFSLSRSWQVHQAHAAQHIGRLGELDIVVADDLNSITPRVPKIKEGAKAFR